MYSMKAPCFIFKVVTGMYALVLLHPVGIVHVAGVALKILSAMVRMGELDFLEFDSNLRGWKIFDCDLD